MQNRMIITGCMGEILARWILPSTFIFVFTQTVVIFFVYIFFISTLEGKVSIIMFPFDRWKNWDHGVYINCARTLAHPCSQYCYSLDGVHWCTEVLIFKKWSFSTFCSLLLWLFYLKNNDLPQDHKNLHLHFFQDCSSFSNYI